jgi:hypothetical protein
MFSTRSNGTSVEKEEDEREDYAEDEIRSVLRCLATRISILFRKRENRMVINVS